MPLVLVHNWLPMKYAAEKERRLPTKLIFVFEDFNFDDEE
jgi:hypothetical protein